MTIESCYNCQHATYHPALPATRTDPPEEAWFYCAQEDVTLPAHVVDKDIAVGSDGCPCWAPKEEDDMTLEDWR